MNRFFRSLALLLFSAILFAQQVAIRGQVKDDSGAVVPAARVEITGPGGVTQSTVFTIPKIIGGALIAIGAAVLAFS